jgi:hypothetical protein
MPISANRKAAGLIVLVILLIFVYAHCMWTDAHAEHTCASFTNAVDQTPVRPNTRESVEAIIAAHAHKEALRIRQARKVSSAVLLGLARGAIIGAVLGTESSIIEGMVSFGALNGILYWVSERINGHPSL